MSFHVITPPKQNAEALAEAAKEVMLFAKDNGMVFSAEGFLNSWVAGTRVLVERDADKKIITLAIAAIGANWVHGKVSASILALLGKNPDNMIEFVKTLTQGAGGSSVYHLNQTPVSETDDAAQYVVTEYKL